MNPLLEPAERLEVPDIRACGAKVDRSLSTSRWQRVSAGAALVIEHQVHLVDCCGFDYEPYDSFIRHIRLNSRADLLDELAGLYDFAMFASCESRFDCGMDVVNRRHHIPPLC